MSEDSTAATAKAGAGVSQRLSAERMVFVGMACLENLLGTEHPIAKDVRRRMGLGLRAKYRLQMWSGDDPLDG